MVKKAAKNNHETIAYQENRPINIGNMYVQKAPQK